MEKDKVEAEIETETEPKAEVNDEKLNKEKFKLPNLLYDNKNVVFAKKYDIEAALERLNNLQDDDSLLFRIK